MNIGQRLTIIRGKLSRRKFASLLGVNQSSVQRWELENQIPKGDVLKRLASDFNVDLNWLLTGEGEGPFKHQRDFAEKGPVFNTGGTRLGVSEPEMIWESAGYENEYNDDGPNGLDESDADGETPPPLLSSEPGFDSTLEKEFNELVIAFIREILTDPRGAKWFKKVFIRNFPEFTDWLIIRNLER